MSSTTYRDRYGLHTPSPAQQTAVYHRTKARAVDGDEAAEEALLIYSALVQVSHRLDALESALTKPKDTPDSDAVSYR